MIDRPTVFIVDVDGTICTKTDGDYENAQPYPDRILAVNGLYEFGSHVIYWTARGATTGKDWSDLTKRQLDEWGCKYHELRMGKPAYDVWIDDKAFNSDQYFQEYSQ